MGLNSFRTLLENDMRLDTSFWALLILAELQMMQENVFWGVVFITIALITFLVLIFTSEE